MFRLPNGAVSGCGWAANPADWTGKLQYQFIRNDEVTVQSQGGPTPHVGTELQTVRIGVNYLFR